MRLIDVHLPLRQPTRPPRPTSPKGKRLDARVRARLFVDGVRWESSPSHRQGKSRGSRIAEFHQIVRLRLARTSPCHFTLVELDAVRGRARACPLRQLAEHWLA